MKSAKPRVARRSLAENAAGAVLRETKIEGLRVDPEQIAAAKGILVKPKPDTADGVSGMLVKVGDEFGILYATNIPSRGFQRFSVAHELGHYFIEGHADQLLANGPHLSHAGFFSSHPFEQEADHFAAALLMPERPFRSMIEDQPPGLVVIEALRKECDTSLTATAIRYAALTSDGVAVILSTGDAIDWCFMSTGLKQAKGLTWLRKGTPLPGGTVTAAFNARPQNVRTGQSDSGEGKLNDWMDGERTYKVTEEVVGLGQYGRTLTVLSCQALSMRVESGDDDEEDDDAMLDSWTPKFRH